MTASITTMESTIQAALRDCYDPSLPCNVVDLGVLESITLAPDPEAPGATIPGVPPKFRVTITLIPTTQDEAANSQIAAQIQNRLAGLETVIHTEITLLQHPAWTPQRITPAGRRRLGLEGNPNLIQITSAR